MFIFYPNLYDTVIGVPDGGMKLNDVWFVQSIKNFFKAFI